MGLSSAAILTVYAMGYLHSQPVSASNLVDLAATGSARPPAAQVPAGQTQTGQTQVGYKDGTYVGKGTSRHGDIQATVVITGGQIVSARVTRCQTRYPCSDVDQLVQEVVSIQAAPVHHISGASDSSRAYKQAVVNALAQAS
jgi:uncharacterized protein with FMN-binding domain